MQGIKLHDMVRVINMCLMLPTKNGQPEDLTHPWGIYSSNFKEVCNQNVYDYAPEIYYDVTTIYSMDLLIRYITNGVSTCPLEC